MPKKPTVKSTKSNATRQLKTPRYKSFRLSRAIKSSKPKLPSSWQLLKDALALVKSQKRFFLIITALYAFLSYVFIKSLNTTLTVDDFKNVLGGSMDISSFAGSVTIFGLLLGNSAKAGNQIVGVYQTIILIVTSLALIFSLRNVYSNSAEPITVKRSFYKGMTPLIPFLLVLLVIGMQLIPLSVGSGIYAKVISGGLAITVSEQLFWSVFIGLLLVLTGYMMSSSIFALYIVTLPDMAPMKSLRAARELVRHRRWIVLRKVLFLPLTMLILMGVVIVPFIAYVPRAAESVFFLASMIVLPLLHTYLYVLYRKLL